MSEKRVRPCRMNLSVTGFLAGAYIEANGWSMVSRTPPMSSPTKCGASQITGRLPSPSAASRIVDPDQAAQPRFRPPPQHAVLERGAHRGLKGLPQPAAAQRFRGVRENTRPDWWRRCAASRPGSSASSHADGVAERRLQRQRQPVQQPQEPDAEPGGHSDGRSRVSGPAGFMLRAGRPGARRRPGACDGCSSTCIAPGSVAPPLPPPG